MEPTVSQQMIQDLRAKFFQKVEDETKGNALTIFTIFKLTAAVF